MAPAGEALALRASDGVRLRGRSFGSGTTAVVLVHMGEPGNSEEDWLPLARRLADAGYRAVAYNRRGVCAHERLDCSGGDDDLEESWRDVVGAVRFLRRAGAERVVLVGASIGAMASLYAASTRRIDVDALVAVAGVSNRTGHYAFHRADLRRLRVPTLFVSGDQDEHAADIHARDWARWSRGELLLLDSDRHGTEMLDAREPTRGPLTARILAFLRRARVGPG